MDDLCQEHAFIFGGHVEVPDMMYTMTYDLIRLPLLALLFVGAACPLAAAQLPDQQRPVHVPAPQREFRAAWVATVANIDWPSRPGLPVAQQQQEARAILDRLVSLRMNAVIFQVRPQADAFYASSLEPWSSYLTGQQGQAPDPLYDPLEFWIRESHARGLVLHAWCNPYRANHPANRGGLCDQSIIRTHPELVVQLGNKGYYWMDPALPAVQDHTVAVILDIVRRYDVDGIHFDDYFYPYPSYHDNRDFPDDKSWAAYRTAGGSLTRGDWRRQAVNTLIERLYREIKDCKPHVEFGISPFGIWRPGHPPGIQGLDQYATLYADAKLWLNKGWIDYLTPQLYWRIAQGPQSFPVLLGWWKKENTQGRHLWPGTSLSHLGKPDGATEIVNQIMIVRGMLAADPGLCMFSMKSLLADDCTLIDQLVDGPYAREALIPASAWLDSSGLEPPQVTAQRQDGQVSVAWTLPPGEPPFLWVLYARRNGAWTYKILPAKQRHAVLTDDRTPVSRVALSAVDRSRNESTPTVVEVE